RIHLFESKNAPAHDRNLFHHIGLLIEDLDTLVHRLRAGGRDVTDITAVPGGGFAMVTGPDGLLIELFEVTSEESRRHFVDDGSPAPATDTESVCDHFYDLAIPSVTDCRGHPWAMNAATTKSPLRTDNRSTQHGMHQPIPAPSAVPSFWSQPWRPLRVT